MKTLLQLALTGLSALGLLSGCASPAGPAGTHQVSVQRLVSEDDQVRIEELRVRGQTQRLSVQSKGTGAPGYDILPPGAGQDLTKSRDAAGQRVWPVLSF